jgi:hypothetical protein
MRQELDPEYDIAVNNMLPFEGDAPRGWEVNEAEFATGPRKSVKMKILCKEEENGISQIFQMKDGRFVLEREGFNFEEIEYFCSNDLADLL